MNTDRLNSLDTEKSILGGMLLYRNQAERLKELVRKDWFTGYRTLTVFQVVTEMMDSGIEVESVNLMEELNRRNLLGKIGGASFLAELTDNPCVNAEYHSSLLRQAFVKREMFKFTADVQNEVLNSVDIFQVVTESASRLSAIQSGSLPDTNPANTYHDAALEAVADMETSNPAIRIVTGIESLDQLTGGFRPGELIVFTAETGTGKTLLSSQLARESCKLGAHGLFVSGEMLAKNLALREITTKTGIFLNRLRRPETLNDYERHQIMESVGDFCPVCRIFDKRLTIESIARAASILHHEGNLRWMVIDYDELVEAQGKTEVERQANVAGEAKAMAMRYECVVVLVSQLRKTQGEESRSKPDLNRLYSSAAKAKHASTIVYVDREFVRELKGDETKATICVLKNRDGGSLGKMEATFDVRFLRFTGKPQI